MTYVEGVKLENETPSGTVRLLSSGGFYRAYNHSAWLFQCCISDYKVMKKHITSLDTDVYFIGFPKGNFDKLVNGREIKSTKEGFDVILNAEELPDEKGYETWLATVKAEPASTGDYNSLPLAGEAAEREVIKRLRAFPIESKTMVECVEFLAELRRLLNNK